MLKISGQTLSSFNDAKKNSFRQRALNYVHDKQLVKPEVSEIALNKILNFTEDCCADATILAEQSRLSVFILGIHHGRELFHMDEVVELMTDTRIPERIRVRKLIEISDRKLQANLYNKDL